MRAPLLAAVGFLTFFAGLVQSRAQSTGLPWFAAIPSSPSERSSERVPYEAPAPAALRDCPFCRILLGAKVGTMGVSVEATSTFNLHANFRLSGNFVRASESLTVQGVQLDARLKFGSAQASYDFFPFRRRGFRISPGVLFLNHNRILASTFVPGGAPFSPGNEISVSSPVDPVHGSAAIGFSGTGPSITIGFDTLFRRSGRQWTIPLGTPWSMPFEAGIAYVGAPTVALNFAGSICETNLRDCHSIASDPVAQANIALEAQQLKQEMAPLRTFPIVSIGLAYNFRRPWRSRK